MNRLAEETSPYLLQHADNPVDWYPWGDEALTRAREEDRPILLSIGYAACHWCHVMEHESFEDASTAAVMNERFVNVKVDREERPDLDAVYMEAVVALSGHGGWPMTVFLTPAGEPFYGGTYYPPEPRHGMPSFRQVLDSIAEAWRDRRDDVSRAAAQLVEAVRHSAELRPSLDPLTESVLAAAERNLGATFEPAYGGWGRAPKFPNAPTLEFLLRRDGEAARAMAVKTLDEMAAGGMYDLLGGGFHRYSVDDRWLVPHFEKMLYDNALLAAAYLHGWLVTGTGRYREIASETIDYMLRELLLPEGGLASAQDADTDGVEGPDLHLDGGRRRAGRAARAVRARPLDHPRRARRGDAGAAARDPGGAAEAAPRRQGDRVLERACARGARGGRAAARAGGLDRGGSAARRLPPRPAHGRRRAAAAELSRRAHQRRRLPRRLRERRARAARAARRDGRAALAQRGAPARAAGGRALRRRGARRLLPLARPTASSSSPGRRSSTTTRFRPATRCWRTSCSGSRGSTATTSSSGVASPCFGCCGPRWSGLPSAFGWGLVALDLHLSPPRELAIVGPVGSDVARAALEPWQPRTVVAVGPADDVPLLAGKDLVDGEPAVYVCERFACREPVTDPALI